MGKERNTYVYEFFSPLIKQAPKAPSLISSISNTGPAYGLCFCTGHQPALNALPWGPYAGNKLVLPTVRRERILSKPAKAKIIMGYGFYI